MPAQERSDQTPPTNTGKWTAWYQDLEAPWAYGDPTSYEIRAAWLAGCALVEDWGCGAGWLERCLSLMHRAGHGLVHGVTWNIGVWSGR
jgi:hypothetical protein